jgi:hypothetical protein
VLLRRPLFSGVAGHPENRAFGACSPKMPGEPMRVQPSRAKRATSGYA